MTHLVVGHEIVSATRYFSTEHVVFFVELVRMSLIRIEESRQASTALFNSSTGNPLHQGKTLNDSVVLCVGDKINICCWSKLPSCVQRVFLCARRTVICVQKQSGSDRLGQWFRRIPIRFPSEIHRLSTTTLDCCRNTRFEHADRNESNVIVIS